VAGKRVATMTFETMFADMPAADDPRWTNSVDFDPVQDDINKVTESKRAECAIRLERLELAHKSVIEDEFRVSIPVDVRRYLWTTYKLGDTTNFARTHYLARIQALLGRYR
jgi:hypothetical protein